MVPLKENFGYDSGTISRFKTNIHNIVRNSPLFINFSILLVIYIINIISLPVTRNKITEILNFPVYAHSIKSGAAAAVGSKSKSKSTSVWI